MGEVETQLVGPDPRSGLLDMQAQDFAQGGMQHVGGGMVDGDLLAPGLVDFQPDAVADLQAAFVASAPRAGWRRPALSWCRSP